MPTSLVTGGAGFIGSHVANELLKSGHHVIVLDDLSGGFEENVPTGCVFLKGSITNHLLLEKLFEQYHFDYVYHLAAYAAEGLSHFIRRFNYTNNLIGSVNLVNLSVIHKVKCFVFTSSIAVYGALPPPMKEDMTVQPEDPYGIAKYAVELDLKAAHEMFGLNYVIFRPHNVYGENQNIGDRYRNVIGIFMNQLMQGKPLTIFGDGSQSRAFSYIGDMASSIANCVNIQEAYGQIFNLGADVPYTLKELALAVIKAFNQHGEIHHLPARNEVVHAHADHSKANRVFKINAGTTLDEGLSKMATWAKKSGARKTPFFSNIEVRQNVPSIWLEE